jgi:hypothetical protein
MSKGNRLIDIMNDTHIDHAPSDINTYISETSRLQKYVYTTTIGKQDSIKMITKSNTVYILNLNLGSGSISTVFKI